MPSLQAVRAHNATLRNLPSITALFVGGTSGIGQSTLRQLARHANSPSLTAYIVGRNQARAKPFLSELKEISPQGKFHFIEADVSLARNVDKVCEEIKQKEEKLDYLFMTPGGISVPFKGRDETIEGIDTLFALRYYSRMRFIQNLLPLLSKTPTSSPSQSQSRIISIYGGGFELPINTSDLDLKHSFNLLNAYKHSITMTSLSMGYLSKQYSSVSFIHAFPGLVGTNIYSNSFPEPVAALYNYGIWPMMWPFSVGLEESGERHLFHLTAGQYKARSGRAKNSDVEVASGLDGEEGSGAYLLDWKGEVRKGGRVLQEYREKGVDGMIWKHTEALLEEAVRK